MSLLTWLAKWMGSGARSPRRKGHARRRRLSRPLEVEPLEGRLVPAQGALLATLVNPTPAANDNFGGSVAVSGNLVVVGVTVFGKADAAYLFDATSGALLRTLANPTPAANDNFGASVAVSGNLVVVGARGDDTGAAEAGSAYLFDAASGALLHTLANPTPALLDRFGDSVSVSGNLVVHHS